MQPHSQSAHTPILSELDSFNLALTHALAPYAFLLRGVCRLEASEAELLDTRFGIKNMHSIALVGSAGSAFWQAFCQSTEYQDGKAHALDRYSRRIAQALAPQFQGAALFPFQGPPHLPFLRWANRAEALATSPIKINIHAHYGLWHAYRFALALPFDFAALAEPSHAHNLAANQAQTLSICANCPTQACLQSCPVQAFTVERYDTSACIKHLASEAGMACMQQGCLARKACPEAPHYQYEPAHAAFHMRAFLTSH